MLYTIFPAGKLTAVFPQFPGKKFLMMFTGICSIVFRRVPFRACLKHKALKRVFSLGNLTTT
jgi:hypothetical protein